MRTGSSARAAGRGAAPCYARRDILTASLVARISVRNLLILTRTGRPLRGLPALLLVLATALPGGALAQPDSGSDATGRDTPRSAVRGYLNAIDRGDYAAAAEYLDLRQRPRSLAAYTPEQLARGLSLVLQRALWIDLDALSDQPQGHLDDGLPNHRDLLGTVQIDGRDNRLLLQRIDSGEGRQAWVVSGATIARLPALYDAYRYNAYVEWLAHHVPTVFILGVELFKWLAALSVTAVAAPFVLLLSTWLARLFSDPGKPLYQHVRRLFTRPVATLVLVWIFHAVLLDIGVGAQAQRIASAQTVLILLALWVVWTTVDVLREAYAQRLMQMGRSASLPLLRPLATALKWVFVVLGLLMWLDNIGYQITALLTGLGVGGLAVALVLQRPLEDVLGAVSLYTQQPVRIGDFGRFGGYAGTIEEISLRSTRIRTLENTLVSVPNARMASEPIENLSARTRMLYAPVLHLRHDTDPDRLRALLGAIRQLLESHEQVIREGARVRFTDIGDDGFEVQVFAYVDVTDWARHLEVAESLNFALLERLGASGVRLRVPFDATLTDGHAQPSNAAS